MRLLASLVFLASAQAFACPTLSGTYTCTYQDGSKETMTVSQEQKDGVTVYDYNGSTIPANNQVYPIPDQDNLKSATFRAWCDDNVNLKAEILGKYYDSGKYFGDLTMDMNFSLVNADLKQTTTGFVKNSGGQYPINQEVVCTHN